MTLQNKLTELSEKATQGEWNPERESGPLADLAGKANTGIWSSDRFQTALESGIDDEEPIDFAWILGIWGPLTEEDFSNIDFIVALVNAFRAGKLVALDGLADEDEPQ